MRALREMRRVTRPGGLVAARDGDYGGFTWYPELPVLDEWRRLLHRRSPAATAASRTAGATCTPGPGQAGFTDVTCSSSNWTYATEAERAWWGGLWADRVVKSAFAASALAGGHATAADLERIADGWRAWAADQDGWILVPNGEILCRVS